MNKKTKLFFFPLIISQLIILIILARWIYNKQHELTFDTRGITVSSPKIHTDAEQYLQLPTNDTAITKASSSAKYFFEPGIIQKYSSTLNKVELTYKLNTNHFNNTKNFQGAKPKGTYRIAMLGDSITFGLFVKTSENYSEVLEKMLNRSCTLNRYEVINLGVPGYDLKYSAERLKVTGLAYQPDIVIWQINAGDFKEVNEYIVPHITHAGSISAQIKAKEKYLKEWPEKRLYEYQYAVLADFKKENTVPTYYFSLFPFDSKISGIMNATILKNDKKLFWILEPNIVSAKGVFPDGHPNITGHQLIAQFMLRKLLAAPSFPCK